MKILKFLGIQHNLKESSKIPEINEISPEVRITTKIKAYYLGKDSPALGLHEEIRLLEKSLDELRSRLAESHAARDR